ncbi:hypothetical protein CcrColossus_gp072 [Caulobacter phage CcrColossus]|uniref:Uncharacterized protein n=1 Tax=Caulobacter phage CcrColossus TaxID=1211640 RepID=K4K630_9CAUD|nr:hypothetical protein CcrColossus_gp072 [Caulobacter phage CcrColossus]AFU87942.1 hypothetical protein CcrColossus_gp072 [Caulobacter phage CcrColossus]
MTMLWGFAVFGMFAAFCLFGILAGIIVAAPWALYYHDPTIVLWPATAGMVLMMIWAAWQMFQPRIPNPFRKR